MILTSKDKNKGVLTKYTEIWDGIKKLIEKINDKPGEYEKDFMKIKFNSDYNWPFNKTLRLCNVTIAVRSIFQEDNKYYWQV